ncbi:hypothetical protein Ddye_011837 [Dipteronia dyeriana]|uniref:Calmodulin-binding domain-containing protein n=1 Tax=Dipteronia dyeriana TaxID=168575 RepID=A0AAD9X389_9ROSI|nr:hypothetical protein Ddye_011837 [Dipteronia dyeriana]
MDQDRIEAEADSDETLSIISDTSSQEENSIINTGKREPKNTMKWRSIKLSRLPSFGSCIRPPKSPSAKSPNLYSGYAASSEQSTPIAMPDASPNYTKATNCSDAKKGSLLQESAGMLTRRSSFKSKKSLTRMSSKKKMKKTRSNKVASFGSSGSSTIEDSAQLDQPTVVLRSYLDADFQASLSNSECSVSSNDQNRKYANSTSDSSVRVLKKTSSLRPQRILTKTASLKLKRPTRKKCTQVSEISDSNVDRPTCSSTLKDNKFPHQVEAKTGGGESGGHSAMKVCTYTYCSLHGHRHGNLPPLKRFVSMRRRLLKKQKSMKPESCSTTKAKRSANRRIGTQTSQILCNGDSADKEAIQDNIANSSVTEKVFKPGLNRAGHHSGEDKHMGDCENLTETLLGETSSHPHDASFEQHNTSDSLTAKPETRVAFSAVQETSEEGQIAASSTHSRDDEPIISVDHHKFTKASLPELKDSIQCDSLSLKLDGIVSSSNKEVPMDAIVRQEDNGDSATSLNLGVFKDISESNIEFAVDSSTTRVTGKEKNENFEPDNSFHEGNSPSGDSMLNSTTGEPQEIQTENRTYMGFWGLIYQHMKSGIAAEVETELPLDGKDKEEQVKDDNALLQEQESVSCQSLSGTYQIGMGECDAGDQKFELWQSDAVKLVQEAFDKILSEIPDNSYDDQSISSVITSEEDLLEKNHSDGGERSITSSFEDNKETVKQIPEESEVKQIPEESEIEAVNRKTSEEEKAASKQENKSSQKISKNWSNLKKVIILKRFVKALEKVRDFNPRKPQFLPVDPDPETEKVNLRHQTVEERKNADEWMLDYALRQVISKLAPAQKRKVDLLVQAFETVTPPTDFKTRLRFNAESSSPASPVQACTGSPIQNGEQKKFGSLGKAPYLEMSFKNAPDEVSNISTAKRHIPRTCCDCSNAEVDTTASESAQTNVEDEETVAFNLEKDNNSILRDDQPDLVHDSEIPEVSKEVVLIDIKLNSKKLKTGNLIDADGEQLWEPKSELSSIVSSMVSSASFSELSEEPMAACGGEANSKHEVLQESYPQEESQPHDTIDMVNLTDADGERSREPKSELSSIVSSVVSSASFSELSEEPMEACGGQANPKHEAEHEVPQQSSPREESDPHDTKDTEPESEKQKYMRLWYLVYKHMVSSSAEDGEHPLEGADKEEQGGAEKLLGTEDADSCKDSSEMNHKMLMDNQITSSQKIERQHIEAIKLIEQAIDDIPLPEIQDSTGDQSIPGNKISEQDFQKKHVESSGIFLSNSSDSAEDSFRESNNTKVKQGSTLDPKETWLHSNNISAPEESETEVKLVNKSKQQTQKSWSNLKKMILLQRFIKALERVRKFNPREPQYMSLDSDSEAEKVNLRPQNMEDKKNAEEWMLDHAIQQVVAKLTPARKRKVQLLVEAFETVTPSLDVKTHQQHSSFSSCKTHKRLS